MAFLNFIKRRGTEASPQGGLTDAEAPIALGMAEITGTFMRSQFKVAAAHASLDVDRDKKRPVRPALAFGFGALAYALQRKGIPWTKLPHVSVRFAEVFMPEEKDHKKLAQFFCDCGVDPEYEKFRIAGEKAFSRVMEGDEGTAPYPNDFARLMGYRPKVPY